MKIILELPPYGKMTIDDVVNRSIDIVDGYFIPCTPAGIPMNDCLATSIYIAHRYGVDVYFSLRTKDYSLNHIIERAKTASEYRLKGILVTRGDPPKYNSTCREYSTEYVVDYLRKRGLNIDLGVVTSTRFPLEEAASRVISVKPDFTTIIRFSENSVDYIRGFVEKTRGFIKYTYVFVLIGLGDSVKLFEKLNHPYIPLSRLREVIDKLSSIVDGAVFSMPLELVKVRDVLEYIK